MQAACCFSQCKAPAGGAALANRCQKRPDARQQAKRLVASKAASQPSAAAQCDDAAALQQLQGSAALPRRAALASALAAAAGPWLFAGAALADNEAVKAGLSKYVKRKKLERIDTYIAPLLEAKNQLVRVGRVMLQDPAAARQLLRSGVFAGLRDNVRSVGEYASQRSGDSVGTELVKGFFVELEALDNSLRQSARGGEPLPEEAKMLLEGVLTALDKLLATVPPEAMTQARQVIAAIQELDAEAEAEAAAQLQGGEALKNLDKLL